MNSKLLTATAAMLLLVGKLMAAETMPSEAGAGAELPTTADEAQVKQRTTGQADVAAMEPSTSTQGILRTQQPDEMLTTRIVGRPVYGEQEENVGEITALIVDDEQQIVGAVLSVGGFLGLGGKEVGVAWDELEPMEGGEGFHLQMTQQQLADVSSYQKLDEPAADPELAEPTPQVLEPTPPVQSQQ
jgi:hypothetical protein